MWFTRRQLIQRGSALWASLGVTRQSFAGFSTSDQIDADVVVVGSGIAGLTSAISAKTQKPSARVLVLEKNTTPFYSATAYASGLFNISAPNVRGSGSLYQELLELGHGLNDPGLLAAYADNSQAALKWFTDHGVKGAMKANPALSGRKTFLPKNAGGVRYLEVLYVQATRLGVEYLPGAKAHKLVQTPSGRVGEVLFDNRGYQRSVHARNAVILATGGFMGNIQKIDHYCGTERELLTFSSPASQGEGLDMAVDIGADVHMLDKVAGYAYGLPLDIDTRRGLIFRGDFLCSRGAIAIDRFGRRFVNEDLNSPSVFRVMQSKNMSESYVLASESHLDEFIKEDFPYVIGWDRQRFTLELLGSGSFVQRFKSISQMANKIGVPQGELKDTIEMFNGFLESGKDAQFGRNVARIRPLKPPYFLFACRPVSGVSLGGLRVLSSLQVINTQGQPINGLFAAGELVGGIHGDNFAGGSSLGSAATLGFLAGKSIWSNRPETLP